jgi:hypothetical protein
MGGFRNCVINSDCSNIVGSDWNRIIDSNQSNIMGGAGNHICGTSYHSTILGGHCGHIYTNSCDSTIVGGYRNTICNNSCCSTMIGGINNSLTNSCNSVVIGGSGIIIGSQSNSIILNDTTSFRQTIEKSATDTVSGSPYSVDFTTGAIKYLNSLTTDFVVDFTNVPNVSDTVVTYTLILNQSSTAYMLTGITINGGSSETIKWAGGTPPSGNADQVDIVGLMFIFDNTSTLVQVLGQMGTFA